MISDLREPLNPVAFERAQRRLAERRAADTAAQLWGEGMHQRLAAIGADAVEMASGEPVEALRIAAAAAFACDDPFDIARAVREALDIPALHGGGELVEALQNGRPTESLSAEVMSELEDFSDLWATRDAPGIFAELQDGEDLAAALLARHRFLRSDAAAEIAARTIKRLAREPAPHIAPGANSDLNPFDHQWVGPDSEELELHAKAAQMLNIDSVEQRADAIDISDQAEALELAAQEAGALDLASALKRVRLGMEPDPVEIESEIDPIRSDDRLIDLCSPPGLVGEIMDWMEASSDRPNRALLLGAALTFVGTLAGRKFATPSNLRSNNYVVTLAGSGHGKDHALGRIKTLAAAAGLDRYVGPARIMSASALRKLIAREPSVACYIDEFGGFMGQIHDRRAGLHNAMIRFDMLEMFSAAGTFFAGAEYAGEAATKIFAPNFSISGTSTPDAFWSSLSSLSASDGLLARLLVLDVTGPKPSRIKPRLSPSEVPDALIKAVRNLSNAGGNLASVTSHQTPKAVVVPLDANAEEIDATNIADLDAAEDRSAPDALPFLNRVREHALKLALAVAVGCDPAAPVITGPDLDWAYRLARLSAATLIRESADRIADNERGDAMNRILRMIRAAGPGGVTPGKIADKQRGVDARLRDQILRDLVEAGRVRLDRQSGTGGRARERYIAT